MLLLGSDSDDDGLEASSGRLRYLHTFCGDKSVGEVSDAKVSHLHSSSAKCKKMQNPKRLS